MATSLTVEVYKKMPNDTDLTIYKKTSMPGWNFAFVGGLAYYHSPEDTPASLDPGTLQHQGENLLSLARRVGRLDLDDVRRKDVVYFSVLQRTVVIYPMSWVIPLAAIAAAAYLGVAALGVARRRIRPVEVAAGFASLLVAVPAAVVAVWLIWRAVGGLLVRAGVVVIRPDLGQDMPVSRYDVALLCALSVAAVVVTAAVFEWSGRRWTWEGLGLGVLAWWVLGGVAASAAMPARAMPSSGRSWGSWRARPWRSWRAAAGRWRSPPRRSGRCRFW